MLALDPYSKHMSLPVLRAIHKLVEGRRGGGRAPSRRMIPASPMIRPNSSKLNDELFGDGTGVHTVGKGKVYAGQSLTDVFEGTECGAGLRLHQAGQRCAAALCASQAG